MNEKDYFDRAAETWDQKFVTPTLLSFLERLVFQLGIKKGQRILDIGTGTGVLIPYLAEAVGQAGTVTAIDVSERMIQKCREKHGHLKNVNIEVGNIEDDDFPSETFDAVICFGVFPHIRHKLKALGNINHILKAGGKLVIAHALSSQEVKMHHQKVSEHVAHATLPSKAEMKGMLEQTGFAGVNIKDEPGLYLCIAYKP